MAAMHWRVTGRLTWSPSFGAALVALILALSACGEIPEPEGFSIVTGSTVGGPDEQSATEGIQGQVELGATATTSFVPRAPDDYVPEVLVASFSRLLVAGLDTTRILDVESGGVRAVDDLLGGIVMQQRPPGNEVFWLPAQGSDPQLVGRGDVQLLDVGYVGGSPFAVVLGEAGRIERIRLVDHARTPMVTLAEDESLVGLSASGGLHALIVANERCGDFRFFSAEGREIDLNGPGEPDCIVPRLPAYGAVALSPDAGAVLYTVLSYREDGIESATELVARELSTGIEYFRRKIGEDGDQVLALSFDGQRATYLRQSGLERSVTVLDMSGEGSEVSVAVGEADVESVSFARLPLSIRSPEIIEPLEDPEGLVGAETPTAGEGDVAVESETGSTTITTPPNQTPSTASGP